MSDPLNPLIVPEQTLVQVPPPQESLPLETVTPAMPDTMVPDYGATVTQMPAAPPPGNDNRTMTLAAPIDYDPSKLASHQTRSGSGTVSAGLLQRPQTSAGRFTILRAHAKGGMGQVSVARDTELERDIALKEIHAKYSRDSATLHRFTLEARVTGKLEHPGIVPVYGLGTYADGRPYYAMRFVSGKSFQEAIDDFHNADQNPQRDPHERNAALRNLLRRFIDVCNTIGFAHSRGFLHRDIKPANVMLGDYGETLVVDWGLAKEMKATPQAPIAVMPDTVYDGADSPETLEGFTMYGQTMGTPAYMSPEQAAGKWDITGVASDVYSLGAMLYAALSGQAPYHGKSMEIITKVQKGDFQRVKLVKGSVPGPLDAIVHKAMAFEIKDRYATALELAADVERWLADEPVACYPEPFLVRAGRWVKRHRTAVIAGSVLLLTGMLALAIGLVAVNHQKKQKEQAYLQAAESRGEAREALLTLTDDAVGEVLASSSKPTPEQEKFLSSLIGMYRRFAEKEPDSPETKRFIAGAWYRVGRLEARVERYVQAEESYRLALTMLDAPDLAGVIDAIKTRGDVELYRGIMRHFQKKPEAEADYVSAIATFGELVAKEPKPEYRLRLSQAQDRLGVLYFERRNLVGAESHWKTAFALRQQLAKESPDDAEYKFRLAQSHRQFASLEFARGNIAGGRDHAVKAKAIQDELVKQHETSVPYVALLADIETVLTANADKTPLRKIEGVPKPTENDGLRFARAAAFNWGRLAGLNPGDSKYRLRQAVANINLADKCRENYRPTEARAALDIVFAILGDLERKQPGNPDVLHTTMLAMLMRTQTLRDNSDQSAVAATNESVNFIAKLPKNDPVSDRYAAAALIVRARVTMATETKATDKAKADLDAAWVLVQKSPARTELRDYAMALAAWMEIADDYADTVAAGKSLAAVNLPQGQACFEAACFHGLIGKKFKDSKFAAEPDWKEFPLNRIKSVVLFVSQAVEKGFKDIHALTSDANLSEARVTDQFKAIIDKLTASPKKSDS